MEKQLWYQKTAQETLDHFGVDKMKGLSAEQARDNIQKYGPNKLKEEKKKGFVLKLIDQFKDFLVLILLVASMVSFAVGERTDALIIIAIVLVNALLGLYQEGKAEEAIEALQKMAAPDANVLRDGHPISVPAEDLVPGDIVILETGDIVPADLRLIESANLKIEEASLTGESVSVEKLATVSYDRDVQLGDRENMAFSSTILTYGRGKGVVVETGHSTEIGKIASMIQSYETEQTPLQKKLAKLGKDLGIIVLVVCALVFGIGVIRKLPMLEMFMTSVSLAVAAIPEGLPAIVTVVLSLGMSRMAQKNAIVKKLPAVETLGTTTVICSDKTGTLTQNEMTVVKVYVDEKILEVEGIGYSLEGRIKDGDAEVTSESTPSLERLLEIALLANDAKLKKTEGDALGVMGDPTEGALLTLAGKKMMIQDEFNAKYARLNELPFDSDRKMMTTFHENIGSDRAVSFTKGAPDVVLSHSSFILRRGERLPLTQEIREEILKINSSFASKALRVLAMAYRSYEQMPTDISIETIEKDMVFVGMVGMIDPARSEAKEAIKLCKKAGIIPVMITGDYKETAFAIGKELGMVEDMSQAIMGEELDSYTPEQMRELVKDKRVYARVSPEHKVKIVTALKENGHITAMTGDGVNDALAIKRADIGIAMGITGTDVAKNTAEVILTDDNFASIVEAVRQGRIIYSNIKKFVSFLLSCNIGEILIVLLSIIMKWPIPLLPIQLLWLNLVTDSFPALALGVEQGESEIMEIPPRDPDEPVLDKITFQRVVIQSTALCIAILGAYYYGLKHFGENLAGARTIAFVTLIMAELLRSYSARSQRHTIFEIGIFSNKALVMGTAFSFIMMMVVVYVPFLQALFKTVPLGMKEWSFVLPFALIPFVVGEGYKIFARRNKIE
ncbi:MAG: cation-translocating P-type ATPase [Filifactor alocis]|nr:cation-translocating P-type ATPase [Filifactor alocis]